MEVEVLEEEEKEEEEVVMVVVAEEEDQKEEGFPSLISIMFFARKYPVFEL